MGISGFCCRAVEAQNPTDDTPKGLIFSFMLECKVNAIISSCMIKPAVNEKRIIKEEIR